MGLRKDILVPGETYHIYNRGVEKRQIALDRFDYKRWIDGLAYYRYIDPPVQFSMASPETRRELTGHPLLVRILAYCLMPNHFHLLIEPLVERGVAIFLQKFLLSYSRYFNERHQRVGPLFQGPYQARRIPSTDLLLHVCRYIHLNPYVAGLVEDIHQYKWSSHLEYLKPQPGAISESKEILQHFLNRQEYERFVLDHTEYARSLDAIKHLVFD